MIYRVVDVTGYSTLAEPVILRTVASNIVSYYGMSGDTHIDFNIEEKTDDELTDKKTNHNRIKHENTLVISAEHKITRDITYLNKRLFIHDTVSDFTTYIKYMPYDYNLSLSYRTKNKSTAVKLAETLEKEDMLSGNNITHDIDYVYAVPDTVDALISEMLRINKLKLKKYMDMYSKENTVLLSNSSDTVNKIGINIIDNITSTSPSSTNGITVSEDDGIWTVEFEHRFNISVPVSAIIEQPVIVGNAVIGEKFRMSGVTVKPNYAIVPTYDRVSLPVNDEYRRLITYAVRSNIPGEDVLHNINGGKGKYVLQRSVREYLTREHKHLCNRYESIFFISLYKNKEEMNTGTIVIDKKLNISLAKGITLESGYVYRISLSIILDPKQLYVANAPRLKKDKSTNLFLNSIMGLNIDEADEVKHTSLYQINYNIKDK